MVKSTSLFLFVTFATIGCGSRTSRQTQPAPTKPSFSAWDCQDTSPKLLLQGESDADPEDLSHTVPSWIQDFSRSYSGFGLNRVLWSYAQDRGTKRVTLRYSRGGIPLCRIYGRADDINGQRFIHDRAREFDNARPAFEEEEEDTGEAWQSSDLSASTIAKALHIEESIQGFESKKCFWDKEGKLYPAWEIEANSSIGYIHGFANGEELFAAAPRSMHMDGVSRIYDHNITGDLINVSLHDLDGSGLLRSPRFTTKLAKPFTALKSPSGQFIVDPKDPSFAEISLFSNAELMSEWFRTQDQHENFGCVPIEIQPHGKVPNAAYIPNQGKPFIVVGDDGIGLRNLATDMEAISHEMGHHVLYRVLTDITEEEVRVIHEGLADFFVFAKTKDPCLGETICPASSKICSMPGQCLRSAANTIKFTDADLPVEDHKKSQMLSGMLWDLSQILGFETTTPLVLKSINYLLPRSTYRDLFIALMLSDAELNQGRNACTLFDQAIARGFSAKMAGLDCTSYQKN